MPLTYPAALTQGTTANATDVQGNFDAISTLLNTTKLDNSYIVAGTLTTTQISSTAAIALSKLAAGSAAGQLIVTAASTYVPTYVTPTGDVTPDSTGAFTIGSLKVTNAMLAGSITYAKLGLSTGDIPFAKLAALTSGNILVGNGSNAPASVAVTGDVALTNAGVTTVVGTTLSNAARSASFTVSNSVELVTAAAAARTATLPTAVGISGKEYIIVKTDTSANAVTVATTSSQTINGSSTWLLQFANSMVRVASDGANWVVTNARGLGYRFRAYKAASTQLTLSANTAAKINFASEEYDYNNNYDSVTNFRYTAPVAGVYRFEWSVLGNGSAGTLRNAFVTLRKNGTAYAQSTTAIPSGGGFNNSGQVSLPLAATDYVELWGTSGASDQIDGDASGLQTWFAGGLVE